MKRLKDFLAENVIDGKDKFKKRAADRFVSNLNKANDQVHKDIISEHPNQPAPKYPKEAFGFKKHFVGWDPHYTAYYESDLARGAHRFVFPDHKTRDRFLDLTNASPDLHHRMSAPEDDLTGVIPHFPEGRGDLDESLSNDYAERMGEPVDRIAIAQQDMKKHPEGSTEWLKAKRNFHDRMSKYLADKSDVESTRHRLSATGVSTKLLGRKISSFYKAI